MNDVPQWISIAAWTICLAALSPAPYRILARRGLYLDPVWTIVFLLAINRLSFVFKLSAFYSHLTAVILALAMAVVATSYMRSDKGGKSGGTSRS